MPRIPLLRSSGAGGFSPGIPLWDEGPAAAASPVAEGQCHLGDLAEVLLPWAGPSVPGVRLRGVLGVKPPQGGVVTKLSAFGTRGSCGSAGLRAEAARNCPGLSKCRAPGTGVGWDWMILGPWLSTFCDSLHPTWGQQAHGGHESLPKYPNRAAIPGREQPGGHRPREQCQGLGWEHPALCRSLPGWLCNALLCPPALSSRWLTSMMSLITGVHRDSW